MNNIFISQITKKLENTIIMNKFKNYIGMSHENVTKITVGVFAILCVTNQGSQIGSFFVGTMYPLYISCKSLKSNEENVEQQKELHKYWVVWVTFTRLEIALNAVVTFIPMFSQMKLAIFIINLYNSFQLSSHLFDQAIIPLFDKAELSLIDLNNDFNKDYNQIKDSVNTD